jgi:DNA-binding MarR family transcriptional regulator
VDDRQAFEQLLEALAGALNQAASMHSRPRDFGTGVALTRTEIHTVKGIGDRPGLNLTRLAEHMGVSKSAVSQTLAKLSHKGLVIKSHPKGNAKELALRLTALGRKGYREHERLHRRMYQAAREHFGPELREGVERLTSAMGDLQAIMKLLEQRGWLD